MNVKLENKRFLSIDEIYAFIVTEDGGEGILGFRSGNTWIPMIGADTAQVEQLKPIADVICKQLGESYEIRYFKRTHAN